jgi:two-component system sensor histidine kinase ChvG
MRVATRPIGRAAHGTWVRIEPWVTSQPLWRFCTKSIMRRIFTANLVGFTILFVGLMVMSQANRWLIDAKVESLKTQARIIGVAIASNAKVEIGGLMTLDPARLPDAGASRIAPREDTLSSIELAIAPERVTPILGRLIPGGDVRVRIIGRDGYLVVDSSRFLQRGQISRGTVGAPATARPSGEEKLKSAWTRFIAFITRSDLPVYRDIGSDRGTIYPEVEAALGGDTTRMLLINAEGEQIVSVAAPIMHLGAVQGVVQLSSRPGDIDELLWRQRRAMLVLSLMALLASLFASWMLSRTIAGPMRRLSLAADRVSQSISAGAELPTFPHRRDEVGHMAQAFREMVASLYRRVEASDRFAQDVAHELKNPVAAARATAESLAYAKTDAERAQKVREITGEMIRLNRLITDVAKASRLDGELALQETEPVDLAALADGIASVFADLNGDKEIRVTFERVSGEGDASAYRVNGHEGRLGQVLNNLIDNAISFSPPGGVVAVRIRRDKAMIVLSVDDDGPGIPPDRLEHVFKRFYSDRPQSDRKSGKNSGLGLSISRDIVAAHGGSLTAENRPVDPAAASAQHRLGDELKARRIPGVAGARFVLKLPAISA